MPSTVIDILYMLGYLIFFIVILIFPARKLKLPRATQLVSAGMGVTTEQARAEAGLSTSPH